MPADGFLSEHVDPVLTSGIIGALLGLGLSRKRHAIKQVGAGIVGMSAGSALASGILGARRTPDLSGLTEAERRVVREEADRMIEDRGSRRVSEIMGGVGTAMLSGDPTIFAATIPRATIAPYGDEVARIDRMADRFRAARRAE